MWPYASYPGNSSSYQFGIVSVMLVYQGCKFTPLGRQFVFDIGLLKSIAKLTRFTLYTIKVVLFQLRVVLTDCAAQVLIYE